MPTGSSPSPALIPPPKTVRERLARLRLEVCLLARQLRLSEDRDRALAPDAAAPKGVADAR